MTETGWRSRIVGHANVPPQDILPHPLNWRLHPRAQQEAMVGALDEIGWVEEILVSKRTGYVVNGHLRRELALQRNEPTVPVTYLDLSPEEEFLVLATFDPLGTAAGLARDRLDDLLREVKTGTVPLQDMLSDVAAKAGLYYDYPLESRYSLPNVPIEHTPDGVTAPTMGRPIFTEEDIQTTLQDVVVEEQSIVTKNERWFYVEFYAPEEAERYHELVSILGAHLYGRRVDGNLFYEMVKAYVAL